ncbi:hypothetical protein [Corynebacterium suicordis]|uniref:IrrE N-terminal-like domain-containing protein n=1 Tax=Corynebacterium suicordis DSM 45110 TaxID=1121369 RepID=A0ABR9ZLS4_9CORY|nr:hypothetical protein [Corynebacterium suicordis]MBF4554368.1 hypothetical protein [Corynebacterium suicordis DSM 45110]MDR6278608.1 hypothetical protein [Corynebacterium suicordis]
MQWRKRIHLVMLARSVAPKKRKGWSIETLIRNVQRVVGEEIDVVFVEPSAVSGVCGSRAHIGEYNRLCVPGPQCGAGYGLSQELVLVHELAHVLCAHRALNQHNASQLAEQIEDLWPGLNAGFVHQFVDDKQAMKDEQEAEFLSAVILRTAGFDSAVGSLLIERRSHRSYRLTTLFGGRVRADNHR